MIYGLIVVDIIMAVTFGLRFQHLPPQIPLYYSRLWGEDQLADMWYVLLVPLILHLFFFLNRFLNEKYFSHDQLMTKIFNVVNWAIIITFTGIFVKIILLVT